MATFEVKAPDGSTWDVTAPDNATESQVMEYAKAQWQKSSEVSTADRARAGVGGVNRGIASIVGLPVDTAENLVNLGKAGYGSIVTALGKPDLAPELTSGTPGGSQWIAQMMERMGVRASNPNPQDVPSQMLYRAGTIAPNAMLPGASVGQTAIAAGGAAVGEQLGGQNGAMIGALAPAAASAVYGATRAQTLQRQQQVNQLRDQNAQQAREAGYTLPPAETNPGNIVNRVGEGLISGKLQTRQEASARNAEVTNRLARQSIGLPPNQPITPDALRTVRENAGQVYEQVKQFGAGNNLRFRSDPAYRQDIQNLNGDIQAAAREFPDLVNTGKITELQKALNVPTITPTAAVELAKNLRFQAKENFKALGDPESRALAQAQRSAADAVEGLIERTLSRSGQPQLFASFKEARTLIARSHDIESALTPNGNVDARVLGNMDKKGKPMGGGLDLVAQTQRAFKTAMQSPEQMGSNPGMSPLDYGLGAATATISGSPAGAFAALARPAVRAGILSPMYQNLMGSPSYSPLLQSDSAMAALMRGNAAGQ